MTSDQPRILTSSKRVLKAPLFITEEEMDYNQQLIRESPQVVVRSNRPDKRFLNFQSLREN